MCCLISDNVYVKSAYNSCKIAFAIRINKLTKGCDFTEENISNSIGANVIVEVSFSVVLKLHDHLVSCRIEKNVTDGRRLESVRFEEHCECKIG